MNTILSWCPGSKCDPCHPLDGGGTGGTGGTGLLPPFTDAAVTITQYQVYISANGQESLSHLGRMIIYTAADNLPPQGAFGVPNPIGPPEYGFVSTLVLYSSFIQILHPYYPPGSYDGSLADVTSGSLGAATGNPVTDAANTATFQAASATAGDAAIAQAMQTVG